MVTIKIKLKKKKIFDNGGGGGGDDEDYHTSFFLFLLVHVFNLFGARVGSTFWGIRVESITQIFLVECFSQSLEIVH
jgi:hypothetical protein